MYFLINYEFEYEHRQCIVWLAENMNMNVCNVFPHWRIIWAWTYECAFSHWLCHFYIKKAQLLSKWLRYSVYFDLNKHGQLRKGYPRWRKQQLLMYSISADPVCFSSVINMDSVLRWASPLIYISTLSSVKLHSSREWPPSALSGGFRTVGEVPDMASNWLVKLAL